MPMDFSDNKVLIARAKQRGFREKWSNESMFNYRMAFSDFMFKIDQIESHEIRMEKPWDQWTDADKGSFTLRMMLNK